MTRPTRHMGSGRTQVFPEHWGADHGRALKPTDCNSRITIAPEASLTGVFDLGSGMTIIPAAATVYDGPAWIAAESNAGAALQAEEIIPVRRYEIQLPHDVDTATPDLFVTIHENPDAQLVGAVLVVDQAQRGSRHFTRTLTCTMKR